MLIEQFPQPNPSPDIAYFTESGALAVPRDENENYYKAMTGRWQLNAEHGPEARNNVTDTEKQTMVAGKIEATIQALDDSGESENAYGMARKDFEGALRVVSGLKEDGDHSMYGLTCIKADALKAKAELAKQQGDDQRFPRDYRTLVKRIKSTEIAKDMFAELDHELFDRWNSMVETLPVGDRDSQLPHVSRWTANDMKLEHNARVAATDSRRRALHARTNRAA